MRIAVVGAGVAGLSASWLLSQRHEVVLFEREMRLGGHANTVEAGSRARVPVDTGFIVYNTAAYPNLIALLEHQSVATAPSDMSFAVSLGNGAYEYSGSGLSGFFGQRSNLLSPAHWRMGAEILRFFRQARRLEEPENSGPAEALGAWLESARYSRAFIERHIAPMAAAIWSSPVTRVLDMPAAAFVRFFANHGLLQLDGRPQWRTVRGGSRAYVKRLTETGRMTVAKGDPVVSILRGPGGVAIRTAGGASSRFDRCLVATHADEALRLLKDADAEESRFLSAFSYARNHAVLHTDPSYMPRRRHLWSSWNYRGGGSGERGVSLTYWMNRLQPLGTEESYFVTLNPETAIPDARIVEEMTYDHPMFDAAAMAAQKHLWLLQGRRRTWYAGSYFAYGFHECALQSGLAAAEEMGDVRRPWKVEGESDRLQFPLAGRGVPSGVAAQ